MYPEEVIVITIFIITAVNLWTLRKIFRILKEKYPKKFKELKPVIWTFDPTVRVVMKILALEKELPSNAELKKYLKVFKIMTIVGIFLLIVVLIEFFVVLRIFI
jgi:hypothetical protein